MILFLFHDRLKMNILSSSLTGQAVVCPVLPSPSNAPKCDTIFFCFPAGCHFTNIHQTDCTAPDETSINPKIMKLGVYHSQRLFSSTEDGTQFGLIKSGPSARVISLLIHQATVTDDNHRDYSITEGPFFCLFAKSLWRLFSRVPSLVKKSRKEL